MNHAAAITRPLPNREGQLRVDQTAIRAYARAALESGHAAPTVEVLFPHVGRVVIANPKQVRLNADAKIKTDKIAATVLAKLHASGFLPQAWVPDARTAPMSAASPRPSGWSPTSACTQASISRAIGRRECARVRTAASDGKGVGSVRLRRPRRAETVQHSA